MGFDKSTPKKKILKRKFKNCYLYFRDRKKYCDSIYCNEDDLHIHDGSIYHEQKIQEVSSHISKKVNGKTLFNKIYGVVAPFIQRCKFNIFVLDRHGRPPIKDIDTSRSYNPDARVFKEVSDRVFPYVKDERANTLNKLIKKVGREKRKISKEKIGQKKLMGIQKYSSSKNGAKFAIECHAKIKCLETEIKKLETRINQDPRDVWKDGKGVEANRKMVYKYYTKKFNYKFREDCLSPEHQFLFDGAVLNNDFVCVKFMPCGKMESGVPSECVEGEQATMYHAYKSSQAKVVHHSTDTDYYTYLGLFHAIEYNKRKTESFIFTHNFYTHPRYRSNTELAKNIKNTVYEINTTKMNLAIERDLGKIINNPVIAYWVLMGGFLGNDFIADVHKTFQKPNQYDSSSEKFILFWTETALKSGKFKNPVFLEEVFDKRYDKNVRYDIKINMDFVFYFMRQYNKEFGYKLTKEKRIKLAATCLNTNYVAHYMVNHYRLKRHRGELYPPCDAEDKNGSKIFAYEEINGKIFQSERLPRKVFEKYVIG